MDLHGFRFDKAPYVWSLQPADPEVASVQQLLEKFMEEWQWDKKPLGWVRDPKDKEDRPYFHPMTNYIVAPYRRNFYITIERAFREMFGPHVVRLLYRSYQLEKQNVWVAICQIKGMWHSDERMLAAMIEAIDNGELYQSEKTAKTIVLK